MIHFLSRRSPLLPGNRPGAKPHRLQRLNGQLTHVVRAGSTSEEAMRQLAVHEADRVVVAIGGHLAESILTTSLVIRFGVETIWAKANDDAHEAILRQLGVEHVVHPERGVSVVAVKDQGRWLYPDRDYVLQQEDTLLVAGPTGQAEAFAQLH